MAVIERRGEVAAAAEETTLATEGGAMQCVARRPHSTAMTIETESRLVSSGIRTICIAISATRRRREHRVRRR